MREQALRARTHSERRNLTTAVVAPYRFGHPHSWRSGLRGGQLNTLALIGIECQLASMRGAMRPVPAPANTHGCCFSQRLDRQTPRRPRVRQVSESEEKTAGGILLPDTAKEKPPVGEVVQVGPGKCNDDGSRQAPEVGVGDKVLYSKYAGTDIKLGSDEYVLLSEKDILAVVN